MFLGLIAPLFSVIQRQRHCGQKTYSFVSSHQNFTSFSNCLFTKDSRALICVSWRSCKRGLFLILEHVKPSFLNNDLEISLLWNVMLTSHLGWNWSLSRFFRRFLAKVSVSSLVFHGSRPSESLCISSLWSEKNKQEPRTAWIWPLSIFVSNNNSRSQIHTELFSSRHADSNVAGRGMSTFAKEQTHLDLRIFQKS